MRKRQRILGSKGEKRDFPGSPVIKTLPSNAGVQVRSLVGELRSHMLLAWPKKKEKNIYPSALLFSQTCKKVKGRELQDTAGTTEKCVLQHPWESCTQGEGHQEAWSGPGVHLEERSLKLGLSRRIGKFPGGLRPHQTGPGLA